MTWDISASPLGIVAGFLFTLAVLWACLWALMDERFEEEDRKAEAKMRAIAVDLGLFEPEEPDYVYPLFG